MLNPFIVIAVDIAVLLFSVYYAIAERGTVIGWVFAGLVIWWTIGMITAIKDTSAD